MHEVGIIRNLIDMVEAEARSQGAARVTKVSLRLGEVAGVSREALELAFEAMKKATLAAGAKLEVKTIRLRAQCDGCGEVKCSAAHFNLLCPHCGDALNIVAGKEIRIESIDIEEA
jgi:hydrogenase nickel incorporation protein HypA/HybF